jgi:hypothetical protein
MRRMRSVTASTDSEVCGRSATWFAIVILLISGCGFQTPPLHRQG